ncbi:MAG: VCBS repeat-containing protein, partial [Myxococcales bacterium]|nr:VCBS repeat-containing protein [Myxococcales bacterium]
DLYVSNDFFTADRLYRNAEGMRFVEVTGLALPHTPWFSMGAEAGDLDGDGWLDLLATDMSGTTHFKQKLSMGDMSDDGWFLQWAEPRQYMRNALYLNTGTGRFAEAAYLTGMANTDWTWSPRFADFDEDGRLDVFVTNGMTRDFSDSDLRQRLKDAGRWQDGDLEFWNEAPRRDEANLAFRNRGDLDFEPVGVRWGLGAMGISFGAAVGDLDGDGDPDLVVNDFEAPPRLYRNTTHGTRRLQVALVGPPGNPGAVGAQVRITSGERIWLRDRPTSSGFMSADDGLIHVGLGDVAQVDDIRVRWPDGRVTHTGPRPADYRYTIRWAADAPADEPPPLTLTFQRPTPLRRAPHQERPFDDFARQPLLPMQHSQLGPGVAVGDVNGDGHEDLWIGGASGQPGALLINQVGGFSRPAVPALEPDAAAEDLGGLFFDADGDGDLDLYVVSGSVEGEPGDARYRDRLYLNDGAGRLTRAEEALPDLRDSGAAVTAGDVDGDGDLDLFVGGRVVPGAWPTTPASRVLLNEGGRFSDGTAAVAPALGQAGLVTAAVWVDLDRDGDQDLLLAREWGGLQLWRNAHGKLTDDSASVGLDRHRGWWNAVVPADVDGDGDLDALSASVSDDTIAWYENLGGSPIAWAKRTIATDAD